MSKQISDRLKSALASTETEAAPAADGENDEPAADATESGIVTTDEELRAYYAVTAILSPDIAPERVVIRDGKSMFAILLDNTNRKPICRLYFNQRQKKLGLLDEHKAARSGSRSSRSTTSSTT